MGAGRDHQVKRGTFSPLLLPLPSFGPARILVTHIMVTDVGYDWLNK